jgi:hypothetical protein
MTKLEELKAAVLAAAEAEDTAWDAAQAAKDEVSEDDYVAARDASWAAWGAYEAELSKTREQTND